jgi:lipopolysaccharide exporter
MRLRRRFERHSEFIGNFATLMSGRAAAGAIALVTMPIVSRLFTPEHFGVAALFVAVVSLIATISTLKYDLAIVLPADDREALTIMAFSYHLVFFVAALVFLAIAAFEAIGVSIATLDLLGRTKWLLPVGVLLMGIIIIQEEWLTRTKSFRISSASLVVGNATTGGGRIGFGALLGSSPGGLVWGYLVGLGFRLIVQRSASREGMRAVVDYGGWSELRSVALRYIDFPKFSAPASFLFALGQKLPVVLFGVMFSPAIAGFYSMARMLVKAPLNMVASSTRRVFRQKAASIHNQGKSLQQAYLLTSGALALLGAPALLLVLFFAQPLATWFLGQQWILAGRYVEILAPWLFMIWFMAPCNPVFVILRKQGLWLNLQIALTLLRLSAFGLAFLLAAGPEWTLQAYVLVTVAGQLAMWAVGLLIIRQHNPEPPSGLRNPIS